MSLVTFLRSLLPAAVRGHAMPVSPQALYGSLLRVSIRSGGVRPMLDVHFWYMLDNHTFLRLTGTLDEIADKAKRLPVFPEYRYGMLCPPIFLRDGIESRPDHNPFHPCEKYLAHANGTADERWFLEVDRWKDEVSQLPEVKEFYERL